MSKNTNRGETRGALIVVEGLDRAGKSSQCEHLRDYLQESGHSVKYVRFPDRTTAIGKLIDSYLRGQSQLDDHSIHLLFSANRWEVAKDIKADIAKGITVIVDRYSYSGAVYSAAKGIPTLSLDWAWQPEVGLPRPDMCLFLRISLQRPQSGAGLAWNGMRTKPCRAVYANSSRLYLTCNPTATSTL
ncbi:thymidylate kinase [Aspergillus bombycis]|uniref:dTMP kinase n=1 Tax=Aspergillus bombycis TaxID=109264 RepID=A0A1F7ZM65_9EURO|nr:thymidylate kinase [Aspergillus bombycis]OGM40553.1 thymidylate kinase [Aspergillus bombycis]